MLSFLYRLATEHQQNYGYKPNLLFLNNDHFNLLCQELAEIDGLDELMQFLGMQLVLEEELTHPHVGYTLRSVTALRA